MTRNFPFNFTSFPSLLPVNFRGILHSLKSNACHRHRPKHNYSPTLPAKEKAVG